MLHFYITLFSLKKQCFLDCLDKKIKNWYNIGTIKTKFYKKIQRETGHGKENAV